VKTIRLENGDVASAMSLLAAEAISWKADRRSCEKGRRRDAREMGSKEFVHRRFEAAQGELTGFIGIKGSGNPSGLIFAPYFT